MSNRLVIFDTDGAEMAVIELPDRLSAGLEDGFAAIKVASALPGEKIYSLELNFKGTMVEVRDLLVIQGRYENWD